MSELSVLSLTDAAKQAAGNWREFDCFCWNRIADLERPEDWAIFYTHNRDSGLIDQSNASVIDDALQPFTKGKNPNVVKESHNHWACGWVAGYSIRVYINGRITEAFKTYHELQRRLEEYPILDEEDYSNREYAATLENIANSVYHLKHEYELPEQWTVDVYHWFANNMDEALENCDDNGGYPDESQLRKAFDALGYKQLELCNDP